eukprot:TRINITY_DN554_c0_g1_i2.p1 TRINITY_DN554_c0_g1~~TRINITY_DN554_c0_g1_i2.p1  ORF type:complete len:419 (+),score=177.57 TRINITY_DN554_c0_g1_i2:72-1259(+)
MSQTKILLKIIVIGDAKVGKTALQKQYANKNFSPIYKPTIGADFESVHNGKATLQLWDTAGQERFQSLGVAFYRGADAAIIVFDLHDRASFDHLDSWKKGFEENAGSTSIPMLLIGNKSDVEADRTVTQEEIDAWTAANGDIPFVETSATDYESVSKAFNLIAQIVIDNLPVYDDEDSSDSNTKVEEDDDEYESIDDPKEDSESSQKSVDEYESIGDPKEDSESSYKSVDEYESIDDPKEDSESSQKSVDEYESIGDPKEDSESSYKSVDEYESIDDPKIEKEAEAPADKEEAKGSSLLIEDDKQIEKEEPKKEDPKPVLVEIIDEVIVSDPKPRSSSPAPSRKTPATVPPRVVSSPANASPAPSSSWSFQDVLIPALAAAIIVTVVYFDYRRRN